ncbi:hypothetical protein M0R72_19280 [Candidatus Pacearchaeota archaeon]|jgi:hypothetical protein|nr:hypothetical protein [Candidatus Pacearchaeota archaeon]
MAEFDIQKVRGLCKYVTPAPWCVYGDEIATEDEIDIDGEGNRTIIIPFDGFDLDFIAASRELLPAACDEIERLRDEQEECANSCTLVRDYSKELEQLRADAKNWQCEFPCSEEKWCNRQNLCSEMKSLAAKVDQGRIAYHKQEQGISNLQTALVMRDQTIAEQAKHIQALESDLKYAQEGCPHGWQEHARLAAILGGNDALHVLAQHAMDRNVKLEAALIIDRTEKLVMAFAGYEPPMTMEDCEQMARKQLHTEGLL